ncbi:hypothetical protein J8N05_45090 [Streptomyces sp. BH-SS-21]|uniref:Hydrolase n=1 Tax=Streptomyces liliiviolaceus TaxID=2823109 RepID=A0A940Y103_9ACTN|nr:hypothetical protein [Streptomyces liliiviolaceus]MBQ0855349.1 hypothetical protein [Streptomyces liliiviolaceus]
MRELAPCADALYAQLQAPEHWVPYADTRSTLARLTDAEVSHACRELGVVPAETLMVGDHPAKDGGAAGAGLRAYVLPVGAVPGAPRGLDAVLRLAGAAGVGRAPSAPRVEYDR